MGLKWLSIGDLSKWVEMCNSNTMLESFVCSLFTKVFLGVSVYLVLCLQKFFFGV